MPRGPKPPSITLTDDERDKLDIWTRRPTTQHRLAIRARIVLAAAAGQSNSAIATDLRITLPTVRKWRTRFAASRLDGLTDEPRPGVPRTITDAQVEQALARTLEAKPTDATHWSTRSLARDLGLSQTAVSRIWRAFGLKPHLHETFKLSTDPFFTEKVRDVVGLYLARPRKPLSCASTRRARFRLWTAPNRPNRCSSVAPRRPPTTTSGTAPRACSALSTWRPGRSLASATGGTGTRSSSPSSTTSTPRGRGSWEQPSMS